MCLNQQNTAKCKENQWRMKLERGHFGALFGTFCYLGVMLGSLLCDFEGPLGSIWGGFEHSKMGLVSLRVYVNYFGIIFVGYQK